jgi:hypothetical protein
MPRHRLSRRVALLAVLTLMATACASAPVTRTATPAPPTTPAPTPALTAPAPATPASPSPIASPVAIPALPELPVAGTKYFVEDAWGLDSPRLVYTVPASGWFSFDPYIIGKNDVVDPLDYYDIAMAVWKVGNVKADPCRWSSAGNVVPRIGPTVDDLATALVEQAAGNGPATDVTVSGYAGKKVDLSIPPDLDISTCEQETFGRWAPADDATEKGPHTYGNGQRNIVYILDVDGLRAVIDTMYLPGTTEANLAELEELVASISIEP